VFFPICFFIYKIIYTPEYGFIRENDPFLDMRSLGLSF
jgi:hypothetical protein